jgi:glycosyltransferase involved in cell wall biosynthesis
LAVAPANAYLLVTPVHEEAELLDELLASVRAQELRPHAWVIVDDGSADGTAATLERAVKRDPWIHVVALPRIGRRSTSAHRYAEVLGVGFRAAADIAEADGIELGYIANLDADVRCPPHLMADLVARAEGDRMLGIVSAELVEVREGGEVVPQLGLPCGSPHGGLRLWRRTCLEEIAFYPSPHWASVTGVRARNRGWKTLTCTDLSAEIVRGDATRDGWWAGYRRMGQAEWHVGMHPMVVAAQALTASARERDLRGLALVAGYLESALRRQRRSHDPEVLTYFGDDLPRERLGEWMGRLPRFVRVRR